MNSALGLSTRHYGCGTRLRAQGIRKETEVKIQKARINNVSFSTTE
jgi:hypothetical protein